MKKELGDSQLRELRSLSRETDPELFFETLFHFACRLKKDHGDAAAGVILEILQQRSAPAEIQQRAKEELDAMRGVGGIGLRLEYLGSRAVKESLNYQMILPMMAGTAVGSVLKTGSELRLATFSRSFFTRGFGLKLPRTPPPFSPQPPLAEGKQKPSTSAEPHQVFEQRQTGIITALEELTQAFNRLKKGFALAEREGYRDELERLDRVRQFIERQWQGYVAGGWSREAIEWAQLDLLGRIKMIRDSLAFPEAGEVSGAPRRPWLLRDYQEEMISGVDRDLANKDLPWLGLASPMQTGKSYLIGPLIEVLRRHYGTGARIVVLTSAEIITDQVMQDLLQGFPAHQVGRFDGKTKDIRDITVASYKALAHGDNLAKHFSGDGRPVLLINDEAYSTQAPSFQKIYTHFGLGEVVGTGRIAVLKPKRGNGRVIGLSGTGAGLEAYQISGQFDLFTALQTGRIRNMELDRAVVKISSESRELAGEKMVWWEPTLENARALVEIYQQRMQGKFERTLTYVPTIRHAELLEQAMAERYGEGFSRGYHSKKSDGELKQALTHHETVGGNLTSVGMLSRGYRGTGVGAVFHTYQSNSAELVLQRTGRAWGVPEGEALPDLYVLEVAWSERDSFATVARLLGLIDAPRVRYSTRNLEKSVTVIRRRREWEGEREQKIEIGEVTPLFRQVPLVEEWRIRFGEVVKTAGGVEAVAKQAGLAPEVIAGFALGSLPTEWAEVLRMKDYFGGQEVATELWVRSWKQVVDDVLEGRERIEGALEKNLLTWKEKEAEVVEMAEALDEILGRYFGKSTTKTPKPEWVSPLLIEFRKIVGEGVSEVELKEMFQREVENFAQQLRQTKSQQAKVFDGRFLADPPIALSKIAREIGVSGSYVRQVEIDLKHKFLGQVRRNHPPQVSPLELPVEYVDFSVRVAHALQNNNIRYLGELRQFTEEELLEWKNFGRKSLEEIKKVLRKYALQLKGKEGKAHASLGQLLFHGGPLPQELADGIPIEQLELSFRTTEAIENNGIKYLDELLAQSEAEMLKWRNFGPKNLKEIEKVVMELVSEHVEQRDKNPMAKSTDPYFRTSITELHLSSEETKVLEKAGILTLGDLLSVSGIKGMFYEDLYDLKLQAAVIHTDRLVARLRTIAKAAPPVESTLMRRMRGVIYQELLQMITVSTYDRAERLLYIAVALRALGDSQGAHEIYDALRAIAIAHNDDLRGLTLKIVDGAEQEPLAEKWWLKKPIEGNKLRFAVEMSDWSSAFEALEKQKDDRQRLENLAKMAVIISAQSDGGEK